jgi:hypothetical protein
MAISRRRRGFEKAGAIPVGKLGFPSRRAQELTLFQAWEKVAGKSLARHAVVLGVRRGVLTVQASQRSWYDAVEPLLPQLAARLAVTEPRLGIKKFRLGMAGTDEVSEPQVVPEYVREETQVLGGDLVDAPEEGTQAARRAQLMQRESEGPEEQQPTLTRDELKDKLEAVARRYVERTTE